jgi:hypothetical protein
VRPKQVQVKLAIPFLGELSGTWEPDEAERRAAWELYIELVTRVAVVQLGPTEGLLREALSSLREIFAVTREILRRYGPAVAPKSSEDGLSFGYLAVGVLNGALRPLLAVWHPTLAAYEATRPAGTSPVDWERQWARAEELRDELAATRKLLVEFAQTLGEVAGAASLLPEGAEPKRKVRYPAGPRSVSRRSP